MVIGSLAGMPMLPPSQMKKVLPPAEKCTSKTILKYIR
jgi:hypothetical protein